MRKKRTADSTSFKQTQAFVSFPWKIYISVICEILLSFHNHRQDRCNCLNPSPTFLHNRRRDPSSLWRSTCDWYCPLARLPRRRFSILRFISDRYVFLQFLFHLLEKAVLTSQTISELAKSQTLRKSVGLISRFSICLNVMTKLYWGDQTAQFLNFHKSNKYRCWYYHN